MKNHAFIFSAIFITGALFPLPEFLAHAPSYQSAPNARHLEEIAYDSHTQTLYMFGGAELRDKKWTEPDTFFEFTTEWKQRSEKGPIGRRGHAMVYDEAGKRILVIGGVTTTASGADSVLFDTWAWSAGNWNLLAARCPFKEARAVYNPHSKSIFVYADTHNLSKAWTGGDHQKFELWEFKNETWSKLCDNGPADGPFPLAYNTKSKSVSCLEWKDNLLTLWEWRNNRWNKTEFHSNFPGSRVKYSFAYSTTEKALFIFGGMDASKNLQGDFWKYDGEQWQRIELTDGPSSRASLRLIEGGNRLLLFGGVKQGGLTNELWEFKNNHWKKL